MAADGTQTTCSFDPRASTFGRGQTAYFWEFGRRLVELVQPAPGELILDVAAGTGAVSVALEDAGARIMAADISQPMLSQLEVGSRRIARLGGSALALPFPDHAFDAVTCGFGVAFFPDLPLALREMGRVLRPNGRIGFTWWLYKERTPWVAAFEL
ncbi:MAG TPA: methyltransferase domain-containing protein, partial [Chloroflexota bacterium]|nr:methyltransferase domain-containing protein [Chloroflexota bacterium]